MAYLKWTRNLGLGLPEGPRRTTFVAHYTNLLRIGVLAVGGLVPAPDHAHRRGRSSWLAVIVVVLLLAVEAIAGAEQTVALHPDLPKAS